MPGPGEVWGELEQTWKVSKLPQWPITETRQAVMLHR